MADHDFSSIKWNYMLKKHHSSYVYILVVGKFFFLFQTDFNRNCKFCVFFVSTCSFLLFMCKKKFMCLSGNLDSRDIYSSTQTIHISFLKKERRRFDFQLDMLYSWIDDDCYCLMCQMCAPLVEIVLCTAPAALVATGNIEWSAPHISSSSSSSAAAAAFSFYTFNLA